MKTKNAMQLKAKIKHVSVEKCISPQLALQNYMLERILARIEASAFRKNFIVKGGFLIGSMVGIDTRTTMDLDTTITGVTLSEDKLAEMFEEICLIDVGDDMTFRIDYISEIREGDEYPGLRIALKADYEKMSVPLTIDVTTGDVITPAAVESEIPMMFDEGVIKVFSYNLETILAEKIETILSRGEANTRPRDFYDVFILKKLRGEKCNFKILNLAVERTTTKRGSQFIMSEMEAIADKIASSDILGKQWENYRKINAFARDISFEDACEALKEVLKEITGQ